MKWYYGFIFFGCLLFSSCDLHHGSEGTFIPFYDLESEGPQANPAQVECLATYHLQVQHYNQGATPDPQVVFNWVLRPDSMGALLTREGPLHDRSCPLTLAPEQLTDALFTIGGRYSGGLPPSNPQLHAYLNAVIFWGYILLDQGHDTIDIDLVELVDWRMTDDLAQIPVQTVGTCTVRVNIYDVHTIQGLSQWITNARVLFRITHSEDIQHCDHLEQFPFGGVYYP